MIFTNGLTPRLGDSDAILAAKWLQGLRNSLGNTSPYTAYSSSDSLTTIYFKIALLLNS